MIGPFLRTLRWYLQKASEKKRRPHRRRSVLAAELLEDRTLLATGLLSGSEAVLQPVIQVVLSAPANHIVTVNYAIAGGTATSGKDFTLAPGKLTFQVGETAKAIP